MKNISGQTIQGYELLDRIGAGGFGAVYKAFQSTVGREVAIKVILPAFANKPEFIRRFEMEAQLIARLEHLHIVPLYDFWRDPEGAYIVMRWMRGGSLSAALQSGPFDLEPSALLLDQVAAGLAAAHSQQVVHRDIKPSNILLDEEGNAYLADFGIARDLRQNNGAPAISSKSDGGKIVGSPQYLSPEQIRGEEATVNSDIYSLGITMYELLTGSPPFPGQSSVAQIFKHIEDPLPLAQLSSAEASQAINEVLQKASAKNPKERYQDAQAMAAAFRQAAGFSQDGQDANLVESLTRREQEILALIVDGQTNKQIAQAQFVEISTVKWHIRRIYKKLGVRSRVQAIVRARDLNLILAPGAPDAEDEGTAASISVFLPEPVNPYKGLRSFEPADNRDFFGREGLVERLLGRLSGSNGQDPSSETASLAKRNQARFLALVGPSGSGKSSLLKAGIIPALWSGKIPGSDSWFIIDMVPGDKPLDELEVALTRVAADQASNLRAHLERDERGLSRAARLILPNDSSQLVLVVDQFEELFTLVEEEADRQQFIQLIMGAGADPHGRVRVIISLRADYYDRPLQYPAFGDLLRSQMETLLPLSAGELERAIVNPAQRVGVSFEPGLVATIIEDIHYRPGALPLLQYALTELFEQRDGRLLTSAAYEAIGGAAGALALRAEELYQDQDISGRQAIQQMFLRLAAVGDQVGAQAEESGTIATRKRVPRSELLSASPDPDQLDDIIDTYANYRLLSLDHDGATRRPTVEVAHESILREWDRLEGWIEESRADLTLQRQLIRATAEWLQAGQDNSFLLRGSRLARFESWAKESQLVLTEEERAYLTACLTARDERATAERNRREHEAQLEQRSRQRLRALVVVMGLALIVAIGLSITAVSFANRASNQQRLAEEQRALAEEQQRLATARELAAAALANLETDPERSMLLALEAADITYDHDGTVLPEVQDALHQAVQADRIKLTFPMDGALAYSPDGHSLAIGNDRGALKVWNSETGEQIYHLLGHFDLISDLKFMPDGKHLITSSFDTQVILWDLEQGIQELNLEHELSVGLVAISPDGKMVATADFDGTIRIWDVAAAQKQAKDTGLFRIKEPIHVIDLDEPVFRGLAFSARGRRLGALVAGRGVLLWDSKSGELEKEIPGAAAFSSGLAFSPDGRFMASPSSTLGATIRDAESGDVLFNLSDSSLLADITFSQNSGFAATAANNGTATLWNMETRKQELTLTGRASGFNFIALHPQGKQLATGGEAGLTHIWDVSPSQNMENLSIAAHNGAIHDAVYSPDGQQIASTGEDGRIKIWDATTGRLLQDISGQNEWVHFPVYSPDGRQLAAANPSGGVSLWNASTGQEQLSLPSQSGSFMAISFSPDGRRVAAAGEEGLAHIWDSNTGELLNTFQHDSAISRIVYSQDGGLLWTFDWDGSAFSWDAATGHKLTGSDTQTRSVCNTILWDAELSANGRYWGAAGFDGLAHVYENRSEPGEKADYRREYALEGHIGNVSGLAFHPQETLLATSGFDGTARLWDLDQGAEILSLSNEDTPVAGVDFSPDGRRLVTAGADGTLNVFIIPIEELMDVARDRLSRGLTDAECQRYLHQDSCTLEE